MMTGKTKRWLVIIIALLSFIQAKSQRTIIMESEGGVYKIPCTVNGVKMKLIFDTGAAKVSISLAMAQYLYENGYLDKKDIIGSSKASVASGALIDNIDIIIRDIEISGLHIENVHAWVSKSLNAPLLLGQTAIQKLGPVTIDNNKLIINNASKTLTAKETEDLKSIIDLCISNKDYKGAIRNIYKLERGWGLDLEQYRILIVSCFESEMYEDCINACKWLLNNDKISKTDPDYLNAYAFMAECYKNIKEYSMAIDASHLGLPYCTDESYLIEYRFYYNLGVCYEELNDLDKSYLHYDNAIRVIEKAKNLTITDLLEGRARDKELNLVFLKKGLSLMRHGDPSSGSTYLALGALCGDSECIRYCKLYDINYIKEAKRFAGFLKGKP